MKEIDFLNYWRSGTNTSNPSIQDIIDWAEFCHFKEMVDLKHKCDRFKELSWQFIVSKACMCIKDIIDQGISPYNTDIDFVDMFRKAMEE